MVPLQRFANGVLAGVIRRQPSSPARTAFAWQLAVGPALSRSTTIDLDRGVLRVRVRDDRWIPELERSADTIIARLRQLLGPESVHHLELLRPLSER